ncbi:hypothetical protein DFH28DRAFT_1222610 [Melampsora americana]|nr:hypothetical protein DFH28DRAFT_1222610 [Melampsora americana]
MSSQQSRGAGPYSTPSMGRMETMSALLSANRASSLSARSIRGNLSRPNVGQTDEDARSSDLSSVSTEKILAAIASLANQIELDISNLHEKVDEEIATLSDRSLGHFNALSNKLDRVSEKLDIIEDHMLQPTPPATQAPAPAPLASASPALPWTYSAELKARVYAAAYRKVPTGQLGAYTKRESPDGDLLPCSLFNTVKQEINNVPAPWPEQHLPPQTNGVTDVAAQRVYLRLVKNACKHARERMHHLALHNIRNPREPNLPPEGTIPTIKRLIYRIANHCGDETDDRDIETLWNQTEWSQRIRVAYLRREAIRIFQAVRRGEGRPDIWARVDRQLHKLRVEGPLYTTAFYRLIYNQDLASFDGHGHVTQIDSMEAFDLPSEEDIRNEMQTIENEGVGGAMNEGI